MGGEKRTEKLSKNATVFRRKTQAIFENSFPCKNAGFGKSYGMETQLE